MSDHVITVTTACCGEVLDMPECWKGAPIGHELLRLHVDQCPAVDTMAYVLVGEVETALSKRCDFTRRGASGAVFRCQRYACDGFHTMAREDA